MSSLDNEESESLLLPTMTSNNNIPSSDDDVGTSSSSSSRHMAMSSATTSAAAPPPINIPPSAAFASSASSSRPAYLDDLITTSSQTQGSGGGVFGFAQMYSPSGWKYSRLDRSPHNMSDVESNNGNASNDSHHDDCEEDDHVSSQLRFVYSSSPSSHHSTSRSKTLIATAALLAVLMNVAYHAGLHGARVYKRSKYFSNVSSTSSSLTDKHQELLIPATTAGPDLQSSDDSDNRSVGPYKSGRTNPHVFVCITGQLPRLELSNKINNLFLPWSEQHGATFDVALVLTTTDHKSVTRKEERDQEYYTVQQVYDELSSLGPWMNVLNDNYDVQAQNPILNPHYTNQRAHDTTMSAPQVIERVQNHIRQFESLAECHRHMSMKGDPNSYDIVHRVREDSGYYRSPDLIHIHDVVTAHPMTIMSSDCQFHGGINDRGSFVSPEAAYDYFVQPILGMYLRLLPSDVRNTEQFLMTVYGPTCRLVLTDSFQIFRLWEKVEEDDGGNNGRRDSSRDHQHIAEMEFSRSDLMCLENRHDADPNHISSHTRAKFCHDYENGYKYCVFYDKVGITYTSGEPGLLRSDGNYQPSARLRDDWIPEDNNKQENTEGLTFELLDIGWDSSSEEQMEKMLQIQTNEDIIVKKKAERKKKRQDWKKKHKEEREGK